MTGPDESAPQFAPDGRQIIPAGTFFIAVPHLYPIAAFLRDTGLRLMRERPNAQPGQDGEMGFIPQPDGWRCLVGGPITPEIWAALNQRFALPPTITYHREAVGGGGMIRDNANYVDILGIAPAREQPHTPDPTPPPRRWPWHKS